MVSGTGVSDHPRSRGEYVYQRCAGYHQGGSSPLSRGIRSFRESFMSVTRIIPALAGNTSSRTRCSRTLPDHPRSRGEYIVIWPQNFIRWGSSSLSRGIPLVQLLTPQISGIIPALAGNTAVWPGSPRPFRDHPRSRGEYSSATRSAAVVVGSSPLSRGILHRRPYHRHRRRIIPALAGNTASSTSIPSPGRDHPRSRGEYRAVGVAPLGTAGSSPLSRGIQCKIVINLD